MEDVIFNGSSVRKPVGQASVELVFDNTDTSLGGEYAKFSEIAIKRQVTREGGSKYFLNGSKCRRRDITDIFLGTGLGPRSYAIIEQGMISRLIEAKPEELRVYLEEAAGISKYRQRRRETENRIRHTRENLDRLNDLREEIDKHLKQLKRQANAAERYKTFKQEERRLEAELLVLRYQEIRDSIAIQELKIGEQGTLQQQKIADLRTTEAAIEEQRSLHLSANDKQNTLQGEFYQLGAEISRIEQTIKHQQEAKARFEQQLNEIQQELATSERHLREDQETIIRSQRDIESQQQQKQTIETSLAQHKQAYQQADQALTDWQAQWATLQENIAQPTQQAHIERTRMEQLERQIQQHKNRLERLETLPRQADTPQLQATLASYESERQEITTHYETTRDTLQQTSAETEVLEADLRELQEQLNQARSKQQTTAGKLASLTALQQAALGKDQKRSKDWLNQHGLSRQIRLAETLKVTPGWEKALETVLGKQLEAIEVEDLEQLGQQLLQTLPAGTSLSFFQREKNHATIEQIPRLFINKLQSSSAVVDQLLAHIYFADTLTDALQLRHKLDPHASIICQDGTWLGKNWLQTSAGGDPQESILSRAKTIKQLTSSLNQLERQVTELEAQLEQKQQQLAQTRQQRDASQNKHNALHRKQSQLENNINTLRQRMEQNRQQEKQRKDEKNELHKLIQTLEQEHLHATEQRNAAVTQVEVLSAEKQQLQQQQEALTERIKTSRQRMLETQSRQQQLSLRIESLEKTLQQARQQIERTSERVQRLQQRQQQLLDTQQKDDTPDQDYQKQLESLLEKRKQREQHLQQARTELQHIDHQIRTLNNQRIKQEQAIEQVRDTLQTLKLSWQESSVRMKTLLEQFAETDYELDAVEAALADDAHIKNHQQQLEYLRGKIQRLGAINLAAIDEFEQESARKNYLDEQNDDLIKALNTLETAIGKIDRDTRSLFKDTFDKVNNQIGDMFPRLFGGGKAYLEMTDNNLLTTGVVIMAQPPGKKISNIHLMSGGEKALTAAAMVFAIFELNPAPFCMLDEVDAPLDEANVRRFADLVKHMSERIQFIFITHNKTTMEVAENLIGVTMRELGVSRTVTVNVNDAAEMSNA